MADTSGMADIRGIDIEVLQNVLSVPGDFVLWYYCGGEVRIE